MPGFRPLLLSVAALSWVAAPLAGEPAAPNEWERIAPPIEGRRWDVPFGYDPQGQSLLVLGGRTTWADYKRPRPYDVLRGRLAGDGPFAWQNEFPSGQQWGPATGACQAPAWKDERWHFRDAAGNVRPNWTVYGTFSLGQKYDYDPDTKKFYFYARGKTFSYDPAARTWADLAPPTDPERELGGILLWSSMCYDQHNRRFVLFGGGNVQSPRGDPGTWTYSPADNAWTQLSLGKQPPARANSRLAYHPASKKVVLFGGDQLSQLVADTWTFDVLKNEWQQHEAPLTPSPRAGHALLPLGDRVLLMGGYTYTSTIGYCDALYEPLPLEAWLFNPTAGRWSLVKRWEGKDVPQSPANSCLAATAVDGIVYLLSEGTWRCRLLGTGKSDEGPAGGAAPGAVVRRTGPHDPAWYREEIPPADPAQVAADLAKLEPNRWTLRQTPKRPGPNMDWGSAVFAPELDQILRFSGGHSAYSGTAPQVYDVKTDRYSIPFAPELPIEYVYSNDQVQGEWSFQGNPWMTGHTYKSTGYDPGLKALVFAPHDYIYFFDSPSGKWSRGPEKNPYRADFYNVTVCATPQGAVVWADRREAGGAGLWRLDAKTRTWQPLPLQGKLPAKSPDQHGLAFDSKRNRLLFFSNVGEQRGNVAAYDFASGEAAWLNPAGQASAAAASRETIYLPEGDVVMIGARAMVGDELLWLVYHCERNAWLGLALAGDDPIGKGTAGKAFNNSMGLMYDPARKLVWAVGQHSHVHVLRPNISAARPLPASKP